MEVTNHIPQPIDRKTLRIRSIAFSSWQKLAEDLTIDANLLSEHCIFSDLTLDSWRGHWLERQLCRQLSIDPPGEIQPQLAFGNTKAELIGRLIDSESEGDKNKIYSCKICQKIVKQLSIQKISWILVFPPIKGHFWQKEDLYALQQLVQGTMAGSYQVALVTTPVSVLPPHAILDPMQCKIDNTLSCNDEKIFCPGILDNRLFPEFADFAPTCLKLKRGDYLVSPLNRPESNVQSLTPKQQAMLSLPEYAHLYVFFAINGLQLQNWSLLCQEAGKRFAEGGYHQAIRIYEYLITQAENRQQQLGLIAQIQNIRIALMDFELAAKGSLPDHDSPDEIKAALYQSKAWGLAMCSQADEAEPFFSKARHCLDQEAYPQLYMYLLNISALNQLRLGNAEKAFELEKEIEKRLSTQVETDWHLSYINAINQARLYKKSGDLLLAEQYYQRAFSINDHVRNQSDLIYFNLCQAQLETIKNNHKTALMLWLRCCIHWLSHELPEALAPRVANAILARGLNHTTFEPEEISRVLFAALYQEIERFGLSLVTSLYNYAFIIRNDEIPVDLVFGAPGWGLLGSQQAARSAFHGKYCLKLQRLVSDVINTLCPGLPQQQLNTLVADSQWGFELPTDAKQLICVAIKQNVKKVIFSEKSFSISYQENVQLISQLIVHRSPAIRYVQHHSEGVAVWFRRYRRPFLLDERQTRILLMLDRAYPVSEIFKVLGDDMFEQTFSFLIDMERNRLITLTLETCKQ